MRTPEEVQQVLDATYDEGITGVAEDDCDDVLEAIKDTLRWVLKIDGTPADQFIIMFIEG